MFGSCKNMCRHRSFWASGWPAILLMKPSRPWRLSSMNCSSNRPSSPRNGIWRFHALPGNGGTTIWATEGRMGRGRVSGRSVGGGFKLDREPSSGVYSLCCRAPVRFAATRSRCSAFARWTLSLWKRAGWSGRGMDTNKTRVIKEMDNITMLYEITQCYMKLYEELSTCGTQCTHMHLI